MEIQWKDLPGVGIGIYADGREIARLTAVPGARDALSIDGEALLWRRVCDRETDRMEMALETSFPAEHTMVPAVSYDGNAWGSDHEYKGHEWQGTAYTFASHRTAVPAATASWGEGFSVALCALDGADTAGSVLPGPSGALHRVIWPEVEAPRVLHAHSWAEAYSGTMAPRREFAALVYLGDGSAAAWQRMLRDCWRRHAPLGAPCMRAEEAWRRGIAYGKALYTRERDGLNAFSIGLTWDGKAWVKRPSMKYEIGWCGQNASLAVSFLYHAQMHGDGEAREIGYSVLDSWLEKARSPQGLLLTRYDPPGMPIDAVNLGGAGLQFFEAARIARLLGDEKPAYREAALEVCDFAIRRQRLDGGIGVRWDQAGKALQLQGTAGAYLILPLAAAFLETGKERYNIAAVRAFTYYYNEFHRSGYGTAGALDTSCIDKESVIPLLKGALLLYRATGFPRYLQWAEEAAWYLSTWQWHHTVRYPEDAVLHRMGYDTFGGTAVSTSHHHIDPFALCYVPDLIELAEKTGESQWRERALAIWHNGLQGISDGSLVVMGKAPRPLGSQDEGFLHTRWGQFGVDDGHFSVSQWLVAWPGAFRLEILRGGVSWNLLDGIGR